MLPEPIFQVIAYAQVMGVFHLVLILVALTLAAPCLFISKAKYIVFARGFIVFNALLWLSGMTANLLWDIFVFETIYTSTDYVFDFIPFMPITQGYIDRPWGDQTGHIFYGLSILHVQALWFFFAFATWMTTIFLYSQIRRIWNRDNIEEKQGK